MKLFAYFKLIKTNSIQIIFIEKLNKNFKVSQTFHQITTLQKKKFHCYNMKTNQKDKKIINLLKILCLSEIKIKLTLYL